MSYSSEVLADSPLLYLRLEETSGATCANSGSLGGNATATGTFTRNVASATTELGVAVTLAGSTSDYISYPDTASLDITGDVTYECWTKFASNPVAAFSLMSKNRVDASNAGYELRVLADRTIQVRRGGVSTLLASAAGDYPNDSAWHHLAFTRISNAFVIYLDGSSLASGSSATAVQATTEDFTVGVFHSEFGFQFGFNGTIDEAAVYGSGLSSTRIAAHYAARTAAATFVPQIVIL